MIRAMKVLLGLAQRDDATSSELAPGFPAAEAELSSAREAQAAADTAYQTQLLTADDAAMRRLVEARTDAEVRVDRAAALVDALRERLAAAREREAEADRIIAYEAARKQAHEARDALLQLYPQFAGGLVNLLQAVAEAEIVVSSANANRPRGAEPIPTVEREVRDILADPVEIVSEIEVRKWVLVGDTRPGTFDQAAVYQTGPGRGVLKMGGIPVKDCRQVELRTFIERTVRRGAGVSYAYALASRIALPGLRATDPDLWVPTDSQAPPNQILRQVEELRRCQGVTAAHTTRQVVVELVPMPGAEQVRELPA